MNEEKRKENKKADKKALFIFIPCLIASFFIGFFLSGVSNYMEMNVADVISSGVVSILTLITPYANLVMNAVTIIACIIIIMNTKKKIKKWDGENEEEYLKLDKNLSVIMILSNLSFILSYFFFAAGFEYGISSKSSVVEMICYFGGFLLALGGTLLVQSKVVNTYKELNPEKQGSVYSVDFVKQWEKSCDEAEKMQIYKAAFKAYNFCGTLYIFLWLFCILGNEVWHFGIMPATIVTIIWLVQFIAYQSYAAYYSKNPNKV